MLETLQQFQRQGQAERDISKELYQKKEKGERKSNWQNKLKEYVEKEKISLVPSWACWPISDVESFIVFIHTSLKHKYLLIYSFTNQ